VHAPLEDHTQLTQLQRLTNTGGEVGIGGATVEGIPEGEPET